MAKVARETASTNIGYAWSATSIKPHWWFFRSLLPAADWSNSSRKSSLGHCLDAMVGGSNAAFAAPCSRVRDYGGQRGALSQPLFARNGGAARFRGGLGDLGLRGTFRVDAESEFELSSYFRSI